MAGDRANYGGSDPHAAGGHGAGVNHAGGNHAGGYQDSAMGGAMPQVDEREAREALRAIADQPEA